MTRDTYERALKSAAQIAFLSFVAGCGAAPGEPSATQTEEGATGEATSEALVRSHRGAACHPPPMTDKSCKDAIHAAYPNGDPDWWGQGTPRKPTPASDATLASCCEKLFFKGGTNSGSEELHDSGCCTVLRLANSSVVGVACTPWGPPMPVAMRRRGVA